MIKTRLHLFLLPALLHLSCSAVLYSQETEQLISQNDVLIKRYERKADSLRVATDSLKLIHIMERIEELGFPGTDGEIIRHSAMVLSYEEEHEMARWVMHIILKDVATGRTTRTDDFREDPKVSTGTAREEDYFLSSTDEQGKKQYDGFGYDRGHLAPSADFRWNQKALSESYFYSNMSPQTPGFNRETWATVEDYIRSYAIANEVDLYVVTGPVLREGLPKVERSVSQVSIPEYHYKVAYDLENKRAFGVLMPNKLCEGPVEAYVKPIDEIEALTGLDFLPNLEPALAQALEATADYKPWLPDSQQNDAAMLGPDELDKKQFNTLQAYNFMDSGKNVDICGTVVSTFKSQKGNIFINLDKRFPNTVFTVNIWSRDVPNFSYNPEIELKGKRICVRGEVTSRDGIPQINAASEKQITFLNNF
jgi:endonuclease G, mitochondrial